MKTSNSYQSNSGIGVGIVFMILLFLFVPISGKLSAQSYGRTAFTGISVPVSTQQYCGGGIEYFSIKNDVGFGFQAEYLPETEEENITLTTCRIFLFWPVAENLYIRSGAGVETISTKETIKDSFVSIATGPIFNLKNVYLGIQPNFRLDEGISLSTVSISIGFRFDK